MSRIRVNIDRVVLNGIEPDQRQALLDGLRTGLSRALADPAARADWARSCHRPVLKLGRMPLDPGPSGGRKFAGQIGGAIGKGLET